MEQIFGPCVAEAAGREVGLLLKAMTYCLKNTNKGKMKSLPLPQGRANSAGSLPRELLVSGVTPRTLLPAERPRVRAGRCPICEKRDKGTGLIL